MLRLVPSPFRHAIGDIGLERRNPWLPEETSIATLEAGSVRIEQGTPRGMSQAQVAEAADGFVATVEVLVNSATPGVMITEEVPVVNSDGQVAPLVYNTQEATESTLPKTVVETYPEGYAPVYDPAAGTHVELEHREYSDLYYELVIAPQIQAEQAAAEEIARAEQEAAAQQQAWYYEPVYQPTYYQPTYYPPAPAPETSGYEVTMEEEQPVYLRLYTGEEFI